MYSTAMYSFVRKQRWHLWLMILAAVLLVSSLTSCTSVRILPVVYSSVHSLPESKRPVSDHELVLQQGNVSLSSFTAPFECKSRNLPEKARLIKIAPLDYVIMVHGIADFVSTGLYEFSSWERDEHDLMKTWAEAIKALDPSRNTFVDLGTNIGAHAMHFSASGDYSVHMFEPTLANYELVRCSLAITGVISPTVRLNTFGLGATPHEVCIESPEVNFGGSQAHQARPDCPVANRATIGTMDHYHQEVIAPSKEKVGVLKMDVEGYELDAMLGAVNFFASGSAPVAVFFEFRPKFLADRGGDIMELIQFYISNGYALFGIGDTDPVDISFFEECIRTRNDQSTDIIAVKKQFKAEMAKAGYHFEKTGPVKHGGKYSDIA